jgi:hypothetical protein
MQMWSHHADCKSIISRVWNSNIIGCPMYILSEKLKLLKLELKTWNKNIFGNVHDHVSLAVKKLDSIQEEINVRGCLDELFDQEKQANIDLENALNMEELYWRDKARTKWHCDGDRNTAYFHRIAKIKQTTKKISSLRINDNIVTDPSLIASHVVNHFTALFSTNNHVQDNSFIEDTIPHLVTDSINNLLTMLPSSAEIHQAVFSLNKQSAPGPDGFGAFFYQTYWEIVSKDVIDAVSQFFTSNWILPNWNSNIVVLIPKTDNADSIAQYRPIALANFKFKIISKILADRLAQILPSIISNEQKGFIKGRHIKDCICLSSEVINLLHKKSFGGSLAVKIDIAKAFDTIDWTFLINVLKAFGFNNFFL